MYILTHTVYASGCQGLEILDDDGLLVLQIEETCDDQWIREEILGHFLIVDPGGKCTEVELVKYDGNRRVVDSVTGSKYHREYLNLVFV